MPRPNVLRRCTICKKYGAPFLVETPTGKAYYCYECRKMLVAQTSRKPDESEKSQAQKSPSPERDGQ